jgi:hypothetical protein
MAGDRTWRADPPHGLGLRVGLGQPGREPFGHRVLQVRLDLGQGVPDVPGGPGECEQQFVQVLLDRLGGLPGLGRIW